MDVRLNVIEKRLAGINRIITIIGGKGGIGKSVISSTLALTLSRSGYKVGLLDLDLSCPSDHIILGVGDVFPQEGRGIIPPQVHDIKFMSAVYYVKDNPFPLRGKDISNAIIELLSVTLWGELDLLVIDMPPGLTDATLDTIQLIKGGEFLLVTVPLRIAHQIVKRVADLLDGLHLPIIGIIENQINDGYGSIGEFIKTSGIPCVWRVQFDPELEGAIGKPQRLLKTNFARDIKRIAQDLGK
ncbi:MAG TPA: ATP-binding protein [Candidatus Omnitrophica bacterium]|nr:ATP-binding protein [Candidatus Omnitrophota bacterium]